MLDVIWRRRENLLQVVHIRRGHDDQLVDLGIWWSETVDDFGEADLRRKVVCLVKGHRVVILLFRVVSGA